MLVIQADHLGMCFGVKDALTKMREIQEPQRVTVFGELVHNPVVTEEMAERGFQQDSENHRRPVPATPDVLITAHGVSEKVRQGFLAAGKRVFDTTCPLVRRVHKAARHYHNLGYQIIVIGRRGHVEVEGIVGDLERYHVVSSADEVINWKHPRLAVINQTTAPPHQVEKLHSLIAVRNEGSEIVFSDTVCAPTRDRQTAVDSLLDKVEALVVVGGPNSHNTLQLGQKAQMRGLPWWRVTSADDLREDWFRGIRLVGLTAGTSTTDETVASVSRKLRSYAETSKELSSLTG